MCNPLHRAFSISPWTISTLSQQCWNGLKRTSASGRIAPSCHLMRVVQRGKRRPMDFASSFVKPFINIKGEKGRSIDPVHSESKGRRFSIIDSSDEVLFPWLHLLLLVGSRPSQTGWTWTLRSSTRKGRRLMKWTAWCWLGTWRTEWPSLLTTWQTPVALSAMRQTSKPPPPPQRETNTYFIYTPYINVRYVYCSFVIGLFFF